LNKHAARIVAFFTLSSGLLIYPATSWSGPKVPTGPAGRPPSYAIGQLLTATPSQLDIPSGSSGRVVLSVKTILNTDTSVPVKNCKAVYNASQITEKHISDNLSATFDFQVNPGLVGGAALNIDVTCQTGTKNPALQTAHIPIRVTPPVFIGPDGGVSVKQGECAPFSTHFTNGYNPKAYNFKSILGYISLPHGAYATEDPSTASFKVCADTLSLVGYYNLSIETSGSDPADNNALLIPVTITSK